MKTYSILIGLFAVSVSIAIATPAIADEIICPIPPDGEVSIQDPFGEVQRAFVQHGGVCKVVAGIAVKQVQGWTKKESWEDAIASLIRGAWQHYQQGGYLELSAEEWDQLNRATPFSANDVAVRFEPRIISWLPLRPLELGLFTFILASLVGTWELLKKGGSKKIGDSFTVWGFTFHIIWGALVVAFIMLFLLLPFQQTELEEILILGSAPPAFAFFTVASMRVMSAIEENPFWVASQIVLQFCIGAGLTAWVF